MGSINIPSLSTLTKNEQRWTEPANIGADKRVLEIYKCFSKADLNDSDPEVSSFTLHSKTLAEKISKRYICSNK